MVKRADRRYGLAGILAVLLLVALVAIPALAADPSGTPPGPTVATPASDPTATPSPTPKPTKSPKPTKEPNAVKAPETTVTVTGTVGTRTDADGRTAYTLTTDAVVRGLEAGPPWYWGDKHPLAPYVGKKVTVVGTSKTGTDEIDVTSVDGTQLRAPGRPPWAGGWKVVGKDHPGWSQEKWDRWQAKRVAQAKQHGVECWPPGLCKDKPSGTGAPDAD